jgi:hypothetical protein
MRDPDPRSTLTTSPLERLTITPAMTLGDLMGCSLIAQCVGRCGYLTVVRIAPIINRFGLDARLADLAPKFRCSRCRGAAELQVELA